MASPTQSLKNTVRKTSIARRISPQTQDLPFFDEIVNLIQQAKKVFDAVSREENNTNTGLLFAKDLYDEKVDLNRDNFTISLEGAFRAIGMIFQSNTPREDDVERLIEEFDADYSGWTDFPSFLTLTLAIWQVHQPVSEYEMINRLLATLPHQLRQARKSFYIADSDEDGTITLLEMYDLATKLGKDVDHDGLKAFFSALDKDRSGTIDVQEFYTFWIWSMVKETALGNGFLEKWFYQQNLTKRKKLNIMFSWAKFFQVLFAASVYNPLFPLVENNEFVENKGIGDEEISTASTFFSYAIGIPTILASIVSIVLYHVGHYPEMTISEVYGPLATRLGFGFLCASVAAFVVKVADLRLSPYKIVASSASLKWEPSKVVGNAQSLTKLLLQKAQSRFEIHVPLTNNRQRVPKWVVLLLATCLSIPHAVLHPTYRYFNDLHFSGGKGGLDWYITIVSMIISWIFFTAMLNWLGNILIHTHFRYDCLQYFTFLTNQSQCSAFGLPYLNIEIPENFIAWVKIREYLQTLYPINIRDFEIMCASLIVYIFGLSSALYLQLFHNYFTSFFLVCVYDLFILGIYLLVLISVGVNINQLSENQKQQLANMRWEVVSKSHTRRSYMSVERQTMLTTTLKLLKHQFTLLQERDHDVMLFGAKLSSYVTGFILGNTLLLDIFTSKACVIFGFLSAISFVTRDL